jgi:uncharacterized protein (UPF0332 family)
MYNFKNIEKEEVELFSNLDFEKEEVETYSYMKIKREEANYTTNLNFKNDEIKSLRVKSIKFVNKIKQMLELID